MSTLERAVELFAVIHLGTTGLSHILAPKAWARFFIWLRSKGEPGVFCVAFLSLGFGSIIAAFHPVWSGLPLVLTLLGWAQVAKGLVYFAFPGFGLRKLEFVTLERARMFVYAGFLLLAVAALLIYHLAVS